MICSCSRTAQDDHAGSIAFTSADTEGPVLIHVDDIDEVAFHFDGGMPAGLQVRSRRDGKCVDTIVFETLAEVIALVERATRDSNEADERHRNQSVGSSLDDVDAADF